MLTKPSIPYDLCIAIVGAFSVVTNLRMDLFEALVVRHLNTKWRLEMISRRKSQNQSAM